MATVVTHVSTKYQIVIPKTIRQKLGLAPNDKLMISIVGKGEALLRKPLSAADMRGSYTYPKDYLKKERLSWD